MTEKDLPSYGNHCDDDHNESSDRTVCNDDTVDTGSESCTGM